MKTISLLLALLLSTSPALACDPWSIDRRESYGMNLSASDLLDPATTACRLTTYLREIEEEGFAKQVRIIFTPDWGPQILRDWADILRSKGFRVVAILSQGHSDSELAAQQAWAQYGLPQIADILDAVQPQNESNDTTGWSPEQYAQWHRALVPVIRAAVPGVPIMSPTLNNGANWVSWHHGTGLIPGQDYDILAANVTNWSKKTLKKVAKIAVAEGLPVWLTETRWDEAAKLHAMGVNVQRSYVFVWNEWEGGSMAVRPGGTTPPTCPTYREGYPQ
ncbi:MAG TPA: hypothetical protein VN444_04540 [Verrucomicrobiae bacterium]|nr:hypothetical protein [Verrucomicrobiae bacterium]